MAAMAATSIRTVTISAVAARATGAWPASGPELCAVSSLQPIRPTSTCADFGPRSSCEAAAIDLLAARGETESAQLLLRYGTSMDSPWAQMTNVTLGAAWADTDADPPPDAEVRAFQVGFVDTAHSPRYEGSGGGWRPDPLMALWSSDGGDGPASGFDVPPDTAQPLWIDVAVAPTASPGKYAAEVAVSFRAAARGEARALTLRVPLLLEIVDAAVPPLSESTLGAAWSGSWTDEAFAPYYGAGAWDGSPAVREAWYDAALAHRTPPDAVYRDSPRSAADFELIAGEKGARWLALMDATKLPLEPPSAAAAAWSSPPPGAPLPPEFRSGAPRARAASEVLAGAGAGVGGSCANYTDEYVHRLLATLAPSVEELDRRGLLPRAYVYGFDECPASCEPQVRKLFGAVKAEWPALKTAAVLNWSPMPADLPLDVWILQYQEFDPKDAAAWRESGGTVPSVPRHHLWLYHCIEPHSLRYLNTFVERPALQGRLLFWHAARLEASYGNPTGWLYYSVNLWRPCDSDKCGGAHTPKVLERTNATVAAVGGNGEAVLTGTAFTDFPPANFVWRGRYDDIFANGDGQYYYPCVSGPCPTIRLASVRDGLEDWELFRQAGDSEAVAARLRAIVRSPSDWTTDPWAVEAARRAVLRSLGGSSL